MMVRDNVISRISSLKTLPSVANKLVGLINNPDSDPAEILKAIQLDPALTANVIKAANSAFLGFSSPVNSIAEAGFRIGTKWIYQIALSSLVYSNLKTPASGYDMSANDLWRHSISVAVMAENMCELLGIEDSGAIYTGALLHDIGKIVIHDSVSEYITEIEELIDKSNISFEEAEESIMGMDHCQAGSLLAEEWHFPQSIVEIIRWHHQPDNAEKIENGIDLVHAADVICMLEGFGLGRDGLKYKASEGALARLELTSNMVEKATSQTLESIDSLEYMFADSTAAGVKGGV